MAAPDARKKWWQPTFRKGATVLCGMVVVGWPTYDFVDSLLKSRHRAKFEQRQALFDQKPLEEKRRAIAGGGKLLSYAPIL